MSNILKPIHRILAGDDITTSDVNADVNLEYGYSDKFTLINPEKPITISSMNGFLNLATSEQSARQIGKIRTFSTEISNFINGYPRGTILDYFDPTSNKLRKVMSLHDDNKNDFTIDRNYIYDIGQDFQNAHWGFCDSSFSSINTQISCDYVTSSLEFLNTNIYDGVDYREYWVENFGVNTGISDVIEVPFDSFLAYRVADINPCTFTVSGKKTSEFRKSKGYLIITDKKPENSESDINVIHKYYSDATNKKYSTFTSIYPGSLDILQYNGYATRQLDYSTSLQIKRVKKGQYIIFYELPGQAFFNGTGSANKGWLYNFCYSINLELYFFKSIPLVTGVTL